MPSLVLSEQDLTWWPEEMEFDFWNIICFTTDFLLAAA